MSKYLLAIVFVLISLFEPLHGFFKAPKRKAKMNSTVNRDTEKIMADLTSYQDYQDIYKEMMKISREAMEDSEEDKRSRRLTGLEDYGIDTGDDNRRKGGSAAGESAMGRRRARSQALRREKLNSQGLRSHMLHTRQAVDYTRSMFENYKSSRQAT